MLRSSGVNCSAGFLLLIPNLYSCQSSCSERGLLLSVAGVTSSSGMSSSSCASLPASDTPRFDACCRTSAPYILPPKACMLLLVTLHAFIFSVRPSFCPFITFILIRTNCCSSVPTWTRIVCPILAVIGAPGPYGPAVGSPVGTVSEMPNVPLGIQYTCS